MNPVCGNVLGYIMVSFLSRFAIALILVLSSIGIAGSQEFQGDNLELGKVSFYFDGGSIKFEIRQLPKIVAKRISVLHEGESECDRGVIIVACPGSYLSRMHPESKGFNQQNVFAGKTSEITDLVPIDDSARLTLREAIVDQLATIISNSNSIKNDDVNSEEVNIACALYMILTEKRGLKVWGEEAVTKIRNGAFTDAYFARTDQR